MRQWTAQCMPIISARRDFVFIIHCQKDKHIIFMHWYEWRKSKNTSWKNDWRPSMTIIHRCWAFQGRHLYWSVSVVVSVVPLVSSLSSLVSTFMLSNILDKGPFWLGGQAEDSAHSFNWIWNSSGLAANVSLKILGGNCKRKRFELT